MQGTMGPYFHVGETLYAITVRHNLFPADASNDEFKHNSSALSLLIIRQTRNI